MDWRAMPQTLARRTAEPVATRRPSRYQIRVRLVSRICVSGRTRKRLFQMMPVLMHACKRLEANACMRNRCARNELQLSGQVSDLYFFQVTGSKYWGQRKKLQPSDLANGDRFGAAVALDGVTNTLVVGAPRHTVNSRFTTCVFVCV